MKKLLYFAAIALAAAGCTNNNTCTITGDVANLGDGYVYLFDGKQKGDAIDSAKVENGKFVFKNLQIEPMLARIATSDAVVTFLYVENGNITVAGNMPADSVYVGGSPSNIAFDGYEKAMHDLMQRYRAAESEQDAEAIGNEYDQLINTTIEQNKTNVFGVDLLLGTKGYELSGSEMIAKIDSLPENMKNLAFVVKAKELATRKMKTEPQTEGSDYVPHYIDIAQPNADGVETTLASVVENKANKYVLLDFWASWCGPCMHEVPELVKAYAAYHADGFEIYGVSLDKKAESWKKAMADNNMTWVNVSLLQSFDNKAAEDYAVEAIPTDYLIDCSNGVIVAKNLRGEDVDKKLSELFAK